MNAFYDVMPYFTQMGGYHNPGPLISANNFWYCKEIFEKPSDYSYDMSNININCTTTIPSNFDANENDRMYFHQLKSTTDYAFESSKYNQQPRQQKQAKAGGKEPSKPSRRQNTFQSVYTETFRRIAELPANPASGAKVYRPRHNHRRRSVRPAGDSLSDTDFDTPTSHKQQADTENGSDELVMCLACERVYPSRRSLTGHIGRSGKCRELIGRSYLRQLRRIDAETGRHGGQRSSGAFPAVNPICPHCDRFISHYRGNTRRHVKHCGLRGQTRPCANLLTAGSQFGAEINGKINYYMYAPVDGDQ